jgi:hypothetical protein
MQGSRICCVYRTVSWEFAVLPLSVHVCDAACALLQVQAFSQDQAWQLQRLLESGKLLLIPLLPLSCPDVYVTLDSSCPCASKPG